MKIKKGVELAGIKPEMIPVFIVMQNVSDLFGFQAVLTSGLEGKHKTIVHPLGMATDWRLSKLGNVVDKRIQVAIKERLGDQYDVVLEVDHYHIEFDPR